MATMSDQENPDSLVSARDTLKCHFLCDGDRHDISCPESLVSERDPLKIIADTIAATGVSDPALIAIASKIVHALAMDDYIIKYVGPT